MRKFIYPIVKRKYEALKKEYGDNLYLDKIKDGEIYCTYIKGSEYVEICILKDGSEIANFH